MSGIVCVARTCCIFISGIVIFGNVEMFFIGGRFAPCLAGRGTDVRTRIARRLAPTVLRSCSFLPQNLLRVLVAKEFQQGVGRGGGLDPCGGKSLQLPLFLLELHFCTSKLLWALTHRQAD